MPVKQAWRHKFTKAERIAFTLNTKEFIAAKISQQHLKSEKYR
jgi:hypothetical protein